MSLLILKRLLMAPALVAVLLATSCKEDSVRVLPVPVGGGTSGDTMIYRQEMRRLVQDISAWARGEQPGFIIIPQNGIQLVSEDGTPTGALAQGYVDAIDGVGQEDLYYGYDADNRATPVEVTAYLQGYLDMIKATRKVLATDYCWTTSYVDNSYTWNFGAGHISFAADHRELDNIPAYPASIYGENTNDITSLSDADNFLYIINPSAYADKAAFLAAIAATNYDAVIMDLYFDESTRLDAADLDLIDTKNNGGARLLICYMSIGEAEDYRYYWQAGWKPGSPEWLGPTNPEWAGNYKVRYWYPEWQRIIFGDVQVNGNDSYLKMIIDAGFDGVYLDIIDAFDYWENG